MRITREPWDPFPITMPLERRIFSCCPTTICYDLFCHGTVLYIKRPPGPGTDTGGQTRQSLITTWALKKERDTWSCRVISGFTRTFNEHSRPHSGFDDSVPEKVVLLPCYAGIIFNQIRSPCSVS